MTIFLTSYIFKMQENRTEAFSVRQFEKKVEYEPYGPDMKILIAIFIANGHFR